MRPNNLYIVKLNCEKLDITYTYFKDLHSAHRFRIDAQKKYGIQGEVKKANGTLWEPKDALRDLEYEMIDWNE